MHDMEDETASWLESQEARDLLEFHLDEYEDCVKKWLGLHNLFGSGMKFAEK